jgi:hypothetical protein
MMTLAYLIGWSFDILIYTLRRSVVWFVLLKLQEFGLLRKYNF